MNPEDRKTHSVNPEDPDFDERMKRIWEGVFCAEFQHSYNLFQHSYSLENSINLADKAAFMLSQSLKADLVLKQQKDLKDGT
jgi:hypothetical protein